MQKFLQRQQHRHQRADGSTATFGIRGGVTKGDKKTKEKLDMRVNALNDATVFADGSQFQTLSTSFRHAMSDGTRQETVEDAMKLADAFVRSQFALAKKLLASGNEYQAYFQFGVGLHALQDATSPAHNGFQPWKGEKESWWSIIGHAIQELTYPGANSNLQQVTNTYLEWFENSDKPLPSENLFKNLQHD